MLPSCSSRNPRWLVTSAYMPPTDDGNSTSFMHLTRSPAAEPSVIEREPPPRRSRSSPRPSIGQDGGVVERAAQVRLVGVAQVVLEVEVRRRVAEEVDEALVGLGVLPIRADVVVGLDHEVDAGRLQVRLARDRLEHHREDLVEVGDRRRLVDSRRRS